MPPEGLADLGHQFEVTLQLSRLDRTLVGQVDFDDARNPARAGRHDHHAGRQEDRFGDRVGHEHHGRSSLPPDLHQLEVHPLARHLVEGPEGLVHQQQLGVEGEGARNRDPLLHAARQLPGMFPPEAFELDQLQELARPTCALVPGEAHDLERQLDVPRDRSPVHEHRRLEHHPVIPVEPCAAGGLAVHEDLPRGRGRQVADQPQQCRLATPRRTDEGHELALADLQVDPLERFDSGRARAERLLHAGRVNDRAPHVGSGG